MCQIHFQQFWFYPKQKNEYCFFKGIKYYIYNGKNWMNGLLQNDLIQTKYKILRTSSSKRQTYLVGRQKNKQKKSLQSLSNQFILTNTLRTKQSKFNWKVETKEINTLVWDQIWNKFNRTQFLIAFTNNQEIQYIKDGQILRTDNVKDTSIQPQVMNNLEQIKYLNWFGNYNQNNQKIGGWNAKWKDENLNVGGEYLDGRKQGQWKDLIQNYLSEAQVYEIGKYENDIRKGVWDFVFANDKIGGGKYSDIGNKQGKWIENFFEYAKVTYNGEYNMKNMKVGRWSIQHQRSKSRKQIQYRMKKGEKKDVIINRIQIQFFQQL